MAGQAVISESPDDAIVSRTLNGIVTSWSPAAERMFGYSAEEIVGKHINLLIPEDRTREILSILSEISAGRSVKHFWTHRVRKDGTRVTVSLTISPIRDCGTVVGTCVIYRAMTTEAASVHDDAHTDGYFDRLVQ